METQGRRASPPKTRRRGPPKGDTTSPARKQRLRQRRKAEGWQPYEGWLRPDTAALVAELKQPGEGLNDLVDRALRHLKGQAAADPSPQARKAALVARLWAMATDEKLSHQAIADRLNESGEPTVTGWGRWWAGTVGNLLRTYPRAQG